MNQLAIISQKYTGQTRACPYGAQVSVIMIHIIVLTFIWNFSFIWSTGKLRYLEFQGNGENTSSFPKFEIANYDVTRIHVHEQKCVHFLLNRLSSFRKIGIATKRLYVCNPLCTAHTF